jgi:hypothetical protein
VHDAEDVLHRAVRAHDVLEAEAVAELLVQHPVLAHEVAALHGAAQDEEQLVLLQRLREVVESALAHRVHRAVDGAVRGHEDDAGPRGLLGELGQELDAVHVRHLEVGEDDVEGLARRRLQGLAAVGGGGRLVALRLQDHLEDVALAPFVVYDENLPFTIGGSRRRECRGVTTTNAPPYALRATPPAARRRVNRLLAVHRSPLGRSRDQDLSRRRVRRAVGDQGQRDARGGAWPGSLSRTIVPPWSDTIFLVRARPRPKPVSLVEK